MCGPYTYVYLKNQCSELNSRILVSQKKKRKVRDITIFPFTKERSGENKTYSKSSGLSGFNARLQGFILTSNYLLATSEVYSENCIF